jgi:hypothetical protein
MSSNSLNRGRLARPHMVAAVMATARSALQARSRRILAAGLTFGALATPLAPITALAEPPRPAAMRSSSVVEPGLTEVSGSPYQAYLAADCVTTTLCKFVSSAVKKSRRLEIHRVACQGSHTGTYGPQFIVTAELLDSAGAFVRQIDFLAARYTRTDTLSVWAISEPVLMFVPAGHSLRISVDSGGGSLQPRGCTLSGYLVTPPTSS